MASRLFLGRLLLRSGRVHLPCGGGSSVSRDCALPIGSVGGFYGPFRGVGQVGRNSTSVEPAAEGRIIYRSPFICWYTWTAVLVAVPAACYFDVKMEADNRRKEADNRRKEAELEKAIQDGKQKIKSLEDQIARFIKY